MTFLSNDLLGRQLFEQNKVLASSDTAFYDESGINIDEAVFEGLGDLNIDDDEEEEEEAEPVES
jgi:ribosome assembly protein YihI (activator of Der GTPase)